MIRKKKKLSKNNLSKKWLSCQHRLMAIIGRPIYHSRSPQIHNQAFNFLGMKAHYLRLASSDLEEALRVIQDLDISCFNVTSPYKEKILSYLDEIEPKAKAIGAVNTVIKKGKQLIGFNTDPEGFLWAAKIRSLKLKKSRILVLGAGGAARAVLAALKQVNCDFVSLANRTESKGKELARKYNYSFLPLSHISNNLTKFDLIISCLPQTNYLLSPSVLLTYPKLIEAAYFQDSRSPLKASGLDWLLGQAVAANYLFTGQKLRPKQIEKLQQALTKPELKKESIALIGFMGSGKTQVGLKLAQKMDWSFIDTDRLIEEQTGKRIEDIIMKKGEAEFRRIEASIILSLLGTPRKIVLALGGGAPKNPEIRKILTKNCHVVWLWAPFEKTLQRTSVNPRPLLVLNPSPQQQRKLFEERIVIYSKCCDLIVPNNEGHLNDCVRLIYEEISPSL